MHSFITIIHFFRIVFVIFFAFLYLLFISHIKREFLQYIIFYHKYSVDLYIDYI